MVVEGARIILTLNLEENKKVLSIWIVPFTVLLIT